MHDIAIYLDESGDLGWKFDKPYRFGGSSRHLTLAALAVPYNARHLPKRMIKKFYEKNKWNTNKEKKWSDLDRSQRKLFAKLAVNLKKRNANVEYLSIEVKKENVQRHIRDDSNKLYNYMIRLLLAPTMEKHKSVLFAPDPRSVKIESGNSLHDYLQSYLWFDRGATTSLETKPMESGATLNIQFADMLAGAIQSKFEDNNSEPWEIIQNIVYLEKLYF